MTTSHCYIAHVVFAHITEIVFIKIRSSFTKAKILLPYEWFVSITFI
jgi:hypothetical protein